MKPSSPISRRQFVQLGALAAGASLLPNQAAAAETSALTLPPLPYAFDALEPHIDAKTMEIHHDKHHAAYIAGLTAALAKVPDLAAPPLDKLLANLSSVSDEAIRMQLRNHGGGHWNHSFFWQTLAPAAQSGKPSEKLAAAIDDAFDSMLTLRNAFGEAAAKRFGSGWAWLIVQNGKLKITSTPNQDNPLMKGIVPDADLGTPLLGLDVWEHAYYLHYQNRRPEYIANWWNIVNWPEVSKRFEETAAGK
jgi:superoxide dismutase, Fe-Mn family